MNQNDDQIIFRPFNKLLLSEDEKKLYVGLVYENSKESSKPLPPDNKKYLLSSLHVKDLSSIQNHRYFIQKAGKIIGYGLWIERFTQTNTNRSYITIFVKKEYRNQGLGNKFLKFLLNQMDDKINTVTMGVTFEGEEGFGSKEWLHEKLISLGGKLAYTELKNGVNVKEFDLDEVINKARELKQQANKKGFDIIFSLNGDYRNIYPDKYQDFVQMRVDIWNDMPDENLSMEDEKLTMKEHDEMLDNLIKKNNTIINFIAVHKESGNYAGFTEIWYSDDLPWKAIQDDTGVLKPYRGNKLGLTLKYQMLEYLLTNEKTKNVEWWVTGNASVNSHMQAINKTLRHVPLYRWVEYEFAREVLEERLRSS